MKILLSRPALLTPLDLSTAQEPALQDFGGFLVSRCEGLKPLPSGISWHFRTRTNELLYGAALKIEWLVEALKQGFGAQNLAAIIGTTTTGVEENLIALRENGRYDNAKQSHANPALFLREFFGLKGLCYGVSNACTSGAKALIEGARLIRAGLCKAAIVGGVDSINTLTLQGFKALSITSNAPSRAFCEDRDGINIGEAAALLVMMSEDALKCCDERTRGEFKCELAGFASNTDAFAMTQPSSDLNVKKALLDEALGVNLGENSRNLGENSSGGVNFSQNSQENSAKFEFDENSCENSQKNSRENDEKGKMCKGFSMKNRLCGAKARLEAKRLPSPAEVICRENPSAQANFSDKVDYISAHGTGTKDNDRVEAEFIAAFLPNVPTSSVKPFVGHSLAACGAVEAGLCVNLICESLQKGEAALPPQIYENIDPAFSQSLNLARAGEKKCVRAALSLSFAFGGDNAALYIRAFDGR